jgi:hypothetical protein
MVMFTKEELGEFTLDQLRKLAMYYEIPFTKKDKSSDLVDRLYEVFKQTDSDGSSENTPVSARIRRILEQNKG